MANKPEIQYVGQFYVHGSEARQPEFKPLFRREKAQQPKPVRREKIKVYVDPVALVGFVVAVAMLILMAVSTMQYVQAVEDHDQMERYVGYLMDENSRLNHEYRTNLDMEHVILTSQALGMIPVSEAGTMTVQVTSPVVESEPTVWDDIRWFLDGLFA